MNGLRITQLLIDEAQEWLDVRDTDELRPRADRCTCRQCARDNLSGEGQL